MNEAFNGDRTKNPLIFNHHKINYIALYIDGQQTPGKPIQPDFPGKKYTTSFMKTIEATGTLNSAFGPNLTYSEFGNGYALFGYDLTPDLTKGETVTKRSGKLEMELKYKDILSSQLTLITYAEFDNIIYIDKDRHVGFDYMS